MLYKMVFFFCHVSMFWTLVDLFCTKRLFSQETAFFPDYFTRDKNGRNSLSKEFSCSCAINKFRTGTLCRILNYPADHLKIPCNYSIGSYRSCHPELFCKKGVLKNFAKVTGKHLRQSLRVFFLTKLQAWGLQLYLKKDAGTGVSLCFSQNF